MARAGDPKVRERIRDEVPRFYEWHVHVVLMLASWVGTVVVCLYMVEAVRAIECLWILAGMMLSYTAEYAFHRWPFHLRWGKELYRRHTILHHNFFSYEKPAIDSAEDLWLVLLPPFALPIFWVLQIPLLFLLNAYAGPNAPWLFVFGSLGLYYPIYEVPHFVSHVAIEGGKLDHPFFHAISLHHRLHHQPNLMQYNYSFGISILDRLLGTYTRDLNAKPRFDRPDDRAVQ